MSDSFDVDNRKVREKFADQVVGWQIVGVDPCDKPESLMTLRLERGDERKSLEVYATDLGWWFLPTGTHQWVSFFKDVPASCQSCDLFEDDPRASDPCGTHQGSLDEDSSAIEWREDAEPDGHRGPDGKQRHGIDGQPGRLSHQDQRAPGARF